VLEQMMKGKLIPTRGFSTVHCSQTTSRGFTLVELMVVVALTVIVITLAAPSFQRMIESQRLQSINSQLVTDLQLARSESATRNAYVRVTFRSNASGTCYSLYTYTNNATQCDCRNATPCTAAGLVEIKTVQVKSDTKVQVRPQGGQPIEFAFEPITGALYKVPTDFISPPLTQYTIRTFIDSERALNTIVGLAGRPSVCAPAGSKMQVQAC